jgi:hypothetical protein
VCHNIPRRVVTLEIQDGQGVHFNRRYATWIIGVLLPGVENAGLHSTAANAAKTRAV